MKDFHRDPPMRNPGRFPQQPQFGQNPLGQQRGPGSFASGDSRDPRGQSLFERRGPAPYEAPAPTLARGHASIGHLFAVVVMMAVIGFVAFAAGFAWSRSARADEPTFSSGPKGAPAVSATSSGGGAQAPRVRTIYPKESKIDFEGAEIEGEIRNPGEFYFQHRVEEKFDSLVKRRKNFHREMLRDVVTGK